MEVAKGLVGGATVDATTAAAELGFPADNLADDERSADCAAKRGVLEEVAGMDMADIVETDRSCCKATVGEERIEFAVASWDPSRCTAWHRRDEDRRRHCKPQPLTSTPSAGFFRRSDPSSFSSASSSIARGCHRLATSSSSVHMKREAQHWRTKM